MIYEGLWELVEELRVGEPVRDEMAISERSYNRTAPVEDCRKRERERQKNRTSSITC